jgi:hypothetical protein
MVLHFGSVVAVTRFRILFQTTVYHKVRHLGKKSRVKFISRYKKKPLHSYVLQYNMTGRNVGVGEPVQQTVQAHAIYLLLMNTVFSKRHDYRKSWLRSASTLFKY